MSRPRLTLRTRTFVLWTARLALVAFLVQLAAVDHWDSHFSSVVGVEGSSAHVQHCHGAGDCSTSAGGSTLAPSALPATLPQPSGPAWASEVTAALAPQSAVLTPPSEPPRAA